MADSTKEKPTGNNNPGAESDGGNGLDGGNGIGRREPDIDPDELDPGREEPVGGDPDFDTNLDAFLKERNAEQLPARITLFKLKNPLSTNDSPRSQVDEWTNFIPSWHTIGLKHGAGKYVLHIYIPKGKRQKQLATSRNRVLDIHYDALKRQADEAALLSGAGLPSRSQQITPPAPAPDHSLDVLGRFVGIFTPILAPLITALVAKMNTPQNPGVEMAQMYAGMSQMFRQQMEDNITMMSEAAKVRIEASEGYEDDEEEPAPTALGKPDLLEQIMPFILQMAGMLLKGGPAAAAANTIIKSAPGFQEVIKNPNQMKKIIAHLDNDKKYGPDKTNAMLKVLKIARPK
jgi:hypothetical protein